MLKEYEANPYSYIQGDKSRKNLVSTSIYRYLEFERIVDILKSRRFPLSQVGIWADVYENWFLKSKIFIDDEEYSFSNYLSLFQKSRG